MKKLINTIIIILFAFSSAIVLAQPGPPPPDNDPNGHGRPELGGNAPVGSGILIFLSLSAAYAGRKVYVLRRTWENKK